MKEKLIAKMKASPTNMHFLRVLVGGYIVYLGGGVVLDAIRGAAVGVPMLLLSVLLLLCGVLILAFSLYALLRHYTAEEAAKSREDSDAEDGTDE